jgi:hypothetical protein
MEQELRQIKCMICDFDANQHKFDKFSHFTVGKGKAKYHLMHLPDNSCGLHYALRLDDNNFLCAKRALEPTQEITCWGWDLKTNEFE